jgi:hypothetical protein
LGDTSKRELLQRNNNEITIKVKKKKRVSSFIDPNGQKPINKNE